MTAPTVTAPIRDVPEATPTTTAATTQVAVVSAAVVEPKVQAATASAAITAGMIVPVVLWLLGAYVFGGTVPPQLADALTMLLTAGLTFAAGYRARHVDRTV